MTNLVGQDCVPGHSDVQRSFFPPLSRMVGCHQGVLAVGLTALAGTSPGMCVDISIPAHVAKPGGSVPVTVLFVNDGAAGERFAGDYLGGLPVPVIYTWADHVNAYPSVLPGGRLPRRILPTILFAGYLHAQRARSGARCHSEFVAFRPDFGRLASELPGTGADRGPEVS
jgi:hypothetical protein